MYLPGRWTPSVAGTGVISLELTRQSFWFYLLVITTFLYALVILSSAYHLSQLAWKDRLNGWDVVDVALAATGTLYIVKLCIYLGNLFAFSLHSPEYYMWTVPLWFFFFFPFLSFFSFSLLLRFPLTVSLTYMLSRSVVPRLRSCI